MYNFAKKIVVGGKVISQNGRTFFVYEVGSNHRNDYPTALKYIDHAAKIGADTVKFQLFTARELLNPITTGLGGTYDFLKKQQTPRWWYPKLIKYCKKRKILFSATVQNVEDAKFLTNLGADILKIASEDFNNYKLLYDIACLGKIMIISSGMSTMGEVKHALDAIKASGNRKIIILHTVSLYPASHKDANILVLDSINKKFKVLSGYSENAPGLLVPLASAALGASVIEKHVSLERSIGDLDDIVSLTGEEYQEMIIKIRSLEKRYGKKKLAALDGIKKEYGKQLDIALGSGVKKPVYNGIVKTHPGVKGKFLLTESMERIFLRHGVFPRRKIKKGHKIAEEDLFAPRPAIGISVEDYDKVIGTTAGEDIPVRSPIKFEGKLIKKMTINDLDNLIVEKDKKLIINMIKKTALF